MDVNAAIEHVLNRLRRELPHNCYYHDFDHTLDVIQATLALAEGESVHDPESLALLKTAAAYHDCGFIFQYRANEPVAADLAAKELPAFGYSTVQIETIRRLIMVTTLGNEPTDLMEQIIKDADFDYLGRDSYGPVSLKLKQEWEEAIDMKMTMEEWYNLQEKFLNDHRYYTSTAQRLREPIKQHHLETIRSRKA